MNSLKLNHEFVDNKMGILVPTYNNAATLPKLFKDLLEYTDRIIVVNDGSTANFEPASKEKARHLAAAHLTLSGQFLPSQSATFGGADSFQKAALIVILPLVELEGLIVQIAEQVERLNADIPPLEAALE